MNNLKRYLGVIWMTLGPAAIVFMILQAIEKVGSANSKAAAISDVVLRANATGEAHNTLLQWSIIIIIFVPIAIGIMIFGKYCLSGEYDLDV